MSRGGSDNIDSLMGSLDEWEKKQRGEEQSADSGNSSKQGKMHVGTVGQFFNKINVAAIKLVSDLKVGDIIEIGGEEEAVRQRIASMQIDRKEVEEASEGDDVGIKLKYQVPVGSEVYKIV